MTSSRNNPSFASDAGSGEPSGIYTRRTHKDGTIVKLKRNASIDNFIQDLIAIAVADAVAPLRADLDKIRLEIHTPSTKAGKLFSSIKSLDIRLSSPERVTKKIQRCSC